MTTMNSNSSKINVLRINTKNDNQLLKHSKHTNKSIENNNEWLDCVRWLHEYECLPTYISDRYLNQDLTLGEFANALRDGEILCNLANSILPGAIDTTQINKRAHMSQMLCLKNIRLFLDACNFLFHMNESDLFDEDMLYEFDLARVIKSLSILSNLNISLKHGITGFYMKDITNSAATSNSSNVNLSSAQISPASTRTSISSFNSSLLQPDNDIYYNIMPTEIETPDSFYTDASFLLGNHINDMNHNDNGVYQIIVQQQSQQSQQNVVPPSKRDFVIREIIDTEGNFINGLKTLMDDFLKPLSKILNESDRKCVCINIDKLIKLHQSLFDNLQRAVPGGKGMTERICAVFESFKLELMKEYAEYFSCIDRSIAKCDALTNSGSISNPKAHSYANEFRAKLEECRKASKRGNFKLTDLLRLPYQRVLKYHLLFNELLKQTNVEHAAKDVILKTKESMCEVGNYLNECQRHKENLTQIEKIMAHLINGSSSSNLNLKAYGHYLKDDKFRVRLVEERIARTRTFFLFETALIICKTKGDLYNFKETLLIEDYSIEDPALNNNNNTSNGSGTSNNNNNNNSFNNDTNSVVNIGLIGTGSANAFSLIINNISNRTKTYLFYFKNQEQKKVWKTLLLQAKQKVQPEGQRFNKHLFRLTNFDQEMTACNTCKKYLLGIFYQGYKCEFCSFVAHKDCLFNAQLCLPPTPITLLDIVQQKHQQQNLSRHSSSNNHSQLNIELHRSSSLKQLTVKATYKYDGRPKPPEAPVLTFNEGDIIQVTDDDDDEWWKGYLLKSNKTIKEEGYFPRRHVTIYNTTNENFIELMPSKNTIFLLEEYDWFAPVDRSTADLILNRIQNVPSQTLFMVRCRQEGGYAISIKCNGLVDHIKINVNYLESISNLSNLMQNPNSISPVISQDLMIGSTSPSNSPFYSIDQRNFSSVINLVKYYSQNTLKENFPQLETTLGLPYRLALPNHISVANAIHDYNPSTNPNNTGEQIELKRSNKYFIINKESNGWWRVYNSDGLIGYAPGGYLQETVKI
jgi:guanine nucleotide exchange factor VAV